MVQSPSWETNWFAASQKIPRISRNPKVYYRTHKRPPTVSILGQPNPVHIPTSHLLEIHPNIIHPSTYSMVQSLSWETNWFAARQEIPRISRNPKVHYSNQKPPPTLSILVNPIQSIYPHPTSWRSILILSTHLRLGLPSGLFPPGSPVTPYTPPLLTRTRHMHNPSHSSRFYHPHNIGWGVQII